MRYPYSWAAGLFDGEGSVYYSRSSNAVCLSLSMTDLEPVEAFARLFDLGVRKQPKRGQYKQVWSTGTRGRVKIAVIFKRMRRWLSPRRVAQFETSLASVKHHRVRLGETWGGECPRTKQNSQAGYRWHKTAKELPCANCIIEYRNYMRGYRRSR